MTLVLLALLLIGVCLVAGVMVVAELLVCGIERRGKDGL